MIKAFGNIPMIKHSRSKFALNQEHTTTMNEGTLVPFYVQEVYPGDEFRIEGKFLARVNSSFLKPIMSNLYMDTYYFFCPHRLPYPKWKQVMGENTTGYWAQQSPVNVPAVNLANAKVVPQSLAHYMGIPAGQYPNSKDILRISQLPFRAYAHIYNDWFRNENSQAPALIDLGDGDKQINSNEFDESNIFGMPARVNKYHDYFTSCLPAPQKGSPVNISVMGDVPVITKDFTPEPAPGTKLKSLFFRDTEGNLFNGQTGGSLLGLGSGSLVAIENHQLSLAAGGTAINNAEININNYATDIVPGNLWAQTSSMSSVTVNDLRYAFALQRLLERDARAGTRYTEYLQAHFGVISPDARLQRTEYLGGNREPINVTQVPQTSAGSEDSPQANLAAFSQTFGSSRVTKAFTEHGFVIGVCCIRQKHTYQQGIEKFWFRLGRYDFYDPVFAHIGEQPVYVKEIMAQSKDIADDGYKNNTVFGYQEAWADLRYRKDIVTGYMQSGVDGSLDIWHAGDFYDTATAPTLAPDFLLETPEYLDRTLAVPSTTSPQFIVNFYTMNQAIRVMPTYSVPGLLDHN